MSAQHDHNPTDCPKGCKTKWVESHFPEFAPEGTEETFIFHPCLHRMTREVAECPPAIPSTAATPGSSSERVSSSATASGARSARRSASKRAASSA